MINSGKASYSSHMAMRFQVLVRLPKIFMVKSTQNTDLNWKSYSLGECRKCPQGNREMCMI